MMVPRAMLRRLELTKISRVDLLEEEGGVHTITVAMATTVWPWSTCLQKIDSTGREHTCLSRLMWNVQPQKRGFIFGAILTWRIGMSAYARNPYWEDLV